MPLPLAVGIGSVLGSIVVALAVKVLAALGIGFVTYVGIQLLLDTVLTEIQSNMGAASSTFTGLTELFAYMNVDKAITMIISAITIRATLKGLQAGGDLRKMSFGA